MNAASATESAVDSATDLTDRATAFAILGRMLGPDAAALVDPLLRQALIDVLGRVDVDTAAVYAASESGASTEGDVEDFNRRWIRWFEHGRIAPYEGSNVTGNAGGVTPRLADVAGFYRAFGMHVRAERPDHLIAELEFMSLVLLHEAEAHRAGDLERAEVCAASARSFLRDHLGTWIDGWSARISGEPALAPWMPMAATAAALVSSEARRRKVIPLRSATILVGDTGLPADDDLVLSCGADDEDEEGGAPQAP